MPPTFHSDQSSVSEILSMGNATTRSIANALYSQVLGLHPEVHLLAWPKQRIISFGFGPKKMSQHYAYLGIQSAHVNLGFYAGASLMDPLRLLEGTGKSLRHVKLNQLHEAENPGVLALLRASIEERR